MPYLRIEQLPQHPDGPNRCALRLAAGLSISLGDSRQLLAQVPVILPRVLATERCLALSEELISLGAKAFTEHIDDRSVDACDTHDFLEATRYCRGCSESCCMLCVPDDNAPCPNCGRKLARKNFYFRVRVSVLLLILGSVLLWGYADYRQRDLRNEWDRPLWVAVVLLPKPGVSQIALDKIRQRLPALQQRLATEFRRYKRLDHDPFEFTLLGPIDGIEPPRQPSGAEFSELAQFNYDLWSFSRDVNRRTGADSSLVDSYLYLVISPSSNNGLAFVEGFSQLGGRIGVVEMQLHEDHVDFALFVLAHELFHTLGAIDKYGPDGKTLIPSGLAQPELEPRYPQRYIEIMARTRPTAADREESPESVDELAVGMETAREIGWLK